MVSAVRPLRNARSKRAAAEVGSRLPLRPRGIGRLSDIGITPKNYALRSGAQKQGLAGGQRNRLPDAGAGELAAFRLLESGVLPLVADLPRDAGIKSGMRRLAAGRGPVPLSRHRLDHLLAGHRFALFGENLRRRVQAAQLAVLALGLGLFPFCLSLRLRLGLATFAHNSPPVR